MTSLRLRIALALALVALVATSAVGAIGYRSTSSRLVTEVDQSIVASTAILSIERTGRITLPTSGPFSVYEFRVFDMSGLITQSNFTQAFEIDNRALAVAGTRGATDRSTVHIGSARTRVHTIGVAGGAIQIARSLEETDRVLKDVRTRTVVLVLLVSILAAVIGWMLATSVAAPLRRLTRAAEHIGESGELDVSLPAAGRDEVGRLGSAFQGMLTALQRSRDEQHRLVQDAGHELRTPLTSLRTNLSVIRRHPNMDPEMHATIMGDLDEEVFELTELVNELVAVASGELADQPPEHLDLGDLAEKVAARVARRRDRTVRVDRARAGQVYAPPAALDRAVANLIQNAAKFDQSGNDIEVVVDGAALTVFDRGPGISDEDLTMVFERFHRADAARSMPGSGLGLAIVREIIEKHGGTVRAARRPGGGAAVGFDLPVSLATVVPD